MEKYCINLKLAKKLKKAGFPQKGNFGYFDMGSGEILLESYGSKKYLIAIAPITEEILKELPKEIIHGTAKLPLINKYYKKEIRVSYSNYIETQDKKLSNALAKMWIYLKKEGYLK